MVSLVIQHIRRFATLTENEEALFSNALKHKKLNKKEHLFLNGQTCTTLAFVTTGCLRMYIRDLDGNEQTQQFAIENWWITDYTSFNMQKPSAYSLQAVEDTALFLLDRQAMESLCSQIPSLESYFRKLMQKTLGAMQQRIQYIYTLSGEERYRQFSSLFPDFVQRIPQYMLASYLGFTPEFLSKIRAKKT